ncbi:low temperature requirement protein A [Streptomyces canus]|uniref:low temperature requirement protein A n=1 Tax=Streptomyces canus TaxID=58343 RepID=UPI0027D8841B|nr:low temperature requirement protein A [Streptomyces canus]
MCTALTSSRVTTFELFSDLVYVFTLTQITEYMAHEHTATGVLHGVLLLALVWFSWSGYAWLGNQARADLGVVRAGMSATESPTRLATGSRWTRARKPRSSRISAAARTSPSRIRSPSSAGRSAAGQAAGRQREAPAGRGRPAGTVAVAAGGRSPLGGRLRGASAGRSSPRAVGEARGHCPLRSHRQMDGQPPLLVPRSTHA